MMDILKVLGDQIAETQHLEWRKKRWLIAELIELLPAYRDLLPDSKVFTDLGIRVLCQDLRRGERSFSTLMDIVESSSLTLEGLEEFAYQAEAIAGINLTADTWEDFASEKRGVAECEYCALSYQIFALSACVLSEPMPLELCRKLGHTDLGPAVYDSLKPSLEALVPPQI